jgi:phosphatidylinositol alpha-1,6-mannosyltransferase
VFVFQTSTYGFVFLEVFFSEGGIQSYVRDILQAYLAQADAPPADVFVLWDPPTVENPYDRDDGPFTFHYGAIPWALLGRLRLTLALALYLVRRRPQRIICGHQRLLGLVSLLCTGANMPYSVITYGKDVVTATLVGPASLTTG